MTAEETQSKLTMTESELEVDQMERKHKHHKERKVSLRQGEDSGPRAARTDADRIDEQTDSGGNCDGSQADGKETQACLGRKTLTLQGED